ncbi:MAG: DUF6775 family putative metallopeptidase [Planctomycetota bacterium]
MSGQNVPETVYLYAGADPERVDPERIADFVDERMPSEVELRGDFLQHHLSGDDADNEALAERLARARVKQPDRRAGSEEPKKAEIDYETRFLGAGPDKPTGLLYDADYLLNACATLLNPGEIGPAHCHIAVTNQLVGTWDPHDCRYHARAAVFGLPTLISTCGLVEGPAKPREVYMARQLGMRGAERDPDIRERCLDMDDPRMQEVVEGYLLQALFYHVTGDPFCERKNCRLFNAHWQEDMLQAQTGDDAGLCPEHRSEMEEWTCT